MNYFNKLPTVTYDNKIAVNILARAKLSDQTKGDSRLFLPYTMSDGDRVDTLSQAYYDNPGYTWLIWFANETVDPYYGMPLSEIDLEDYIIQKYGSTELSQRKVKFYRTNGRVDDRTLSKNEYAGLPNGEQKYWEPVLDYLLNVKEYKRKDEPQEITTNRIGSIDISSVTGQFKVGEEVQYTGTNYGFCTFVSNTQLTVNNITGNFVVGTVIIGKESGARATVAACNNAISTTLAYEQPLYWEAVTYFDYELEENEKRKEILLMDVRYTTQAEQELKRTLNR